MFKPYNELKDFEKFQVGKMYTGNLDNYLYDFDDKGFHGRKLPETKSHSGLDPVGKATEIIKEAQKEVGKSVKEVVRRARKK